MKQEALQFVVNTATFNSIIGICLYWLPLVFCIIYYSIKTIRNYLKDIKKRKEQESLYNPDTHPNNYYIPTDTIGTVIGRLLISIIPVGNLMASIFDIAPDVFSRFFTFMDKIYDRPLVPKRERK